MKQNKEKVGNYEAVKRNCGLGEFNIGEEINNNVDRDLESETPEVKIQETETRRITRCGMMRGDIKFRGQRTDTKEWVYGDLIHSIGFNNEIVLSRIMDPIEGESYQIIPNTVGQFTGLKDKYGTESYEGDIFKFKPRTIGHPIRYAFIDFDDRGAEYWLYYDLEKTSFTGTVNLFQGAEMDCEIVGNIYEATEEQLKEWGIE